MKRRRQQQKKNNNNKQQAKEKEKEEQHFDYSSSSDSEEEEEEEAPTPKRLRGGRSGGRGRGRGGRGGGRGGGGAAQHSQEAEEEENKQEQDAPQKSRKDPLQDKQERKKLVSDLMRYTLFSDYKKQAVRREDLKKHVLKDHSGIVNVAQPLYAEAKKKFQDIFGFELKEAVKKKKNKPGAKQAAANRHILVNSLVGGDGYLDWSGQEEEMGFLMMILSIIFLHNGVVDQDTLFDLLKRVGFRQGENHEVFGEWEKLLDSKFTKELYLERKKGDKQSNAGNKLYEYRMGERAQAEVTKKDILHFITYVYGEETVDPHMLKALELEEQESESESDSDSSSSSSSSEEETLQQKKSKGGQSPARGSRRGGRRGK